MAYLSPFEMEELRLKTEHERIRGMASFEEAASARAELEAGIMPASPAPFGQITSESAEPFRMQPRVQPQTRLQQAQTGFSVQPNINVQQPNLAFLKGEDPQVPIRTGPHTAYIPGGSIEGGDRKLFISPDGTMTNFPTSRDIEQFAVKVAKPTSADLVASLGRGAAPQPTSAPQTKEDWEIYKYERASKDLDLSAIRLGPRGQRIGLKTEEQEAVKSQLIAAYDTPVGETQLKPNILAGESSPLTASLLSGPFAKTMTNALIRLEYEFDAKVRPKLAGVRSVDDINKLAKGMETYNPKLASQIKVMFERGLARANPVLYDKLGLSQFAESPLTQSERGRVFDEKTGQTVGGKEDELMAERNAYRSPKTSAEQAKRDKARAELDDLYGRTLTGRKQAEVAVRLSSAASLSKQVAGEDPEAADLAAKAYEGVATKEDLPYLHAGKVKTQISDESWSDVLSEEMVGTGAEGISRVVASKAVLSKEVARDLTDRLAKGYSETAMHDSVKAVLSRHGKNAAVLFGKDVAQDYIKELVTASQEEYDKLAQEAYARMDARKVEKMQSVMDEFAKNGVMPTVGDEERRYKAVQAKKDDAQFIMDSNIGGASGALDTAEDYLMADIMLNWPELEYVARAYLSGNVNVVGASQVSSLLAANLTKFNAQLLSDTAKKRDIQEKKWEEAGFGSAARRLQFDMAKTANMTDAEKTKAYVESGLTWVDPNNPDQNKAGEFWYATPVLGQFARTLDDDQKVVFNQLIGGANESGVWGAPVSRQMREIAAAIAGGQWKTLEDGGIIGATVLDELEEANQNNRVSFSGALAKSVSGGAVRPVWEAEYPATLKHIFESDDTANGLFNSGTEDMIRKNDPRKLNMAVVYALELSRRADMAALKVGYNLALSRVRDVAPLSPVLNELLLEAQNGDKEKALTPASLNRAKRKLRNDILDGKFDESQMISLKATFQGIQADIKIAKGDPKEQIKRKGGVYSVEAMESLEELASEGIASIDSWKAKGQITALDVVTPEGIERTTDIILNYLPALNAISALPRGHAIRRIVQRKIKESRILQAAIGNIVTGNVAAGLAAGRGISNVASAVWGKVKSVDSTLESEIKLMIEEGKAESEGQ